MSTKKKLERQIPEGGTHEVLVKDTQGDGRIDQVHIDTTGDGRADVIKLDTVGDGITNKVLKDTNGDGEHDEIRYDTTEDGQLDFTIKVVKPVDESGTQNSSAELPEEENPLAGLSEEDLKQLQAALQAEAAAGASG
jgi:hypothetical protein